MAQRTAPWIIITFELLDLDQKLFSHHCTNAGEIKGIMLDCQQRGREGGGE